MSIRKQMMSISRRDLLRKIESKQYTILIHLLKLYCFYNNQSKNHWITELKTEIGFFSDATIKSSNSKLKTKDYYDNLTDYLNDTSIANRLDEIIDKLGVYDEAYKQAMLDIIKISNIKTDLDTFYKELSTSLSSGLYTNEILLELLNKHIISKHIDLE